MNLVSNAYGIIIICYAYVWGCQSCMELQFYELAHFTLSSAPSAVHLDLTFDKCMSTCGVQTEVIFVHDPESDRCGCYEMPQSLTNVQDGNRMWISKDAITSSACSTSLVNGNGYNMSDTAITASSEYRSPSFPTYYGCLAFNTRYIDVDNSGERKAWCAANGARTTDQWLQFEFSGNRHVTGVRTRARETTENVQQYVKQYQIQYWLDGAWSTVKNPDNTDKTFTGNTDITTTVTNQLPYIIYTRRVRFIPTLAHSWVSSRVDLMGC